MWTIISIMYNTTILSRLLMDMDMDNLPKHSTALAAVWKNEIKNRFLENAMIKDFYSFVAIDNISRVTIFRKLSQFYIFLLQIKGWVIF